MEYIVNEIVLIIHLQWYAFVRIVFFDDQWWFYANGFGLTYAIKVEHNEFVSEEAFSKGLCVITTVVILTVGIINGIFSVLSIKNKTFQEIGCQIFFDNFITYCHFIYISILILFKLYVHWTVRIKFKR